MRKVWIFLLCLMLLPTMVLTGFATNDRLTVSDAKGKPGDVVFLTVTMNEAVSGDTLSIQYTYDKEILKAVPTSSSWSKQGALQDFGTKDVGVWASSSQMDLRGSICVLAFAIKEDAAFNRTEVTCEITVRAGVQVVGDYTATATVTRLCDHSFGQWQNHGDQPGHGCGKKRRQYGPIRVQHGGPLGDLCRQTCSRPGSADGGNAERRP